MNPKIKPGTIRCKYCNKIKPHVTMPCDCEKKIQWNNPNRGRKTIRLKLERLPEPTEPSKEFRAMLKKKHLSQSKHPTTQLNKKGDDNVICT